VISYHGADVYPTDALGIAPSRLVAYDRSGRLHKMHHKADNPEGWYGKPENSWFAHLANALRPAAQILIIDNARGHSNGMLQFTRYLQRNDHNLMKRIVGSLEADGQDLTEAEVLALARGFYGDDSPRDQGDGRWGGR
jgi:hypothetical protein